VSARVLVITAGIVLSAVTRPVGAGPISLVYVYEGSFNLAIPADSAANKGWMQDAVILVPHHLIVRDLNVTLNVTHTAAFDLRIYLRNPSGRRVTLAEACPLTGYYAGADYRSTTFDDEAETSIEDGTPPFTGSYRPVEPLAAFDGRDAYGFWRLQVYDAYYNDTGYLESFALVITASAPAGTIPAPPAGGLVFLGLGLIGPVLRGHRNRSPALNGSDRRSVLT